MASARVELPCQYVVKLERALACIVSDRNSVGVVPTKPGADRPGDDGHRFGRKLPADNATDVVFAEDVRVNVHFYAFSRNGPSAATLNVSKRRYLLYFALLLQATIRAFYGIERGASVYP